MPRDATEQWIARREPDETVARLERNASSGRLNTLNALAVADHWRSTVRRPCFWRVYRKYRWWQWRR